MSRLALPLSQLSCLETLFGGCNLSMLGFSRRVWNLTQIANRLNSVGSLSTHIRE